MLAAVWPLGSGIQRSENEGMSRSGGGEEEGAPQAGDHSADGGEREEENSFLLIVFCARRPERGFLSCTQPRASTSPLTVEAQQRLTADEEAPCRPANTCFYALLQSEDTDLFIFANVENKHNSQA